MSEACPRAAYTQGPAALEGVLVTPTRTLWSVSTVPALCPSEREWWELSRGMLAGFWIVGGGLVASSLEVIESEQSRSSQGGAYKPHVVGWGQGRQQGRTGYDTPSCRQRGGEAELFQGEGRH